VTNGFAKLYRAIAVAIAWLLLLSAVSSEGGVRAEWIEPPRPESMAPKLIKALKDPEPEARAKAVHELSDINADYALREVIQLLNGDPDRFVRDAALSFVGKYCHRHPRSTSLIPSLIDALRSGALAGVEFPADGAAGILAKFGADAVPSLVQILEDSVKNPAIVRSYAILSLSRMKRGEAKAAVAALIKTIQSREPESVRLHFQQKAADVLGNVGSGAREAIPALAQCVGNGSPVDACHAAAALYRIDPSHVAGLPVLLELLKHADTDIRRLATLTLLLLHPQDQRAVGGLVNAVVQDKDLWVRQKAALALAQIGQPFANTAIPALEKVEDELDEAKQALAAIRSSRPIKRDKK
jgi:HEAT repeat protein